MATSTLVSLWHHFDDLIDSHSERARRHELLDIIGIALGAVLSGTESWTAVEASGQRPARLAQVAQAETM